MREADGTYAQCQFNRQTGNWEKVKLEGAEGLRWNRKAEEWEFTRGGAQPIGPRHLPDWHIPSC